MAWYRAGTVTVANGSASIVGAGTDFVSNVTVGSGFLGPDGRVYEVAQVVSATQLTLASGYMGGGAGAQGYAVLPTQSFARDLALGAAQLLNTFAAVRDGIGQGLIGDGTAAVPGIRFAADQDTGVRRVVDNTVAITTGGVDRLTASNAGVDVAGTAGANNFLVNSALGLFGFPGAGVGITMFGAGANPANVMTFTTSGAERMRVDAAGYLLIGTTVSGGFHNIVTGAAQGTSVLQINNATGISGLFRTVDGGGFSAAAAALWIGKDTSTGRSINAGGTVNASGADYAEYMTKAAGCGSIAAGAVCGVNGDGRLTDRWVEALAFVVKSTDPAYVGGDTWAAHLPPRPEREADEADSAYAARVAPWEVKLEAARQTVDRIAFAGQVPVTVAGDFVPGDYLIAVQDGDGIKAIAVHDADLTFDQYRRRLGRVWAVRDGRAWLDVQHG